MPRTNPRASPPPTSRTARPPRRALPSQTLRQSPIVKRPTNLRAKLLLSRRRLRLADSLRRRMPRTNIRASLPPTSRTARPPRRALPSQPLRQSPIGRLTTSPRTSLPLAKRIQRPLIPHRTCRSPLPGRGQSAFGPSCRRPNPGERTAKSVAPVVRVRRHFLISRRDSPFRSRSRSRPASAFNQKRPCSPS